jgi:hypothetical protein
MQNVMFRGEPSTASTKSLKLPPAAIEYAGLSVTEPGVVVTVMGWVKPVTLVVQVASFGVAVPQSRK